jgi:U6 snRNA-associated Sm-like protein LSm6
MLYSDCCVQELQRVSENNGVQRRGILIKTYTKSNNINSSLFPSPSSMSEPSSPQPPPPPVDNYGSTPPPPAAAQGSPTDFLKGVVGKKVIVRLTSGVDYRGKQKNLCVLLGPKLIDLVSVFGLAGILSCLDGYMNIALEQTEEHVNGMVTNTYGDAFIRGNNVLYISAAEAL